MSNEEIIEEILFESHKLNIADQVFEQFKIFSQNNNRVDAYILSLNYVKNKLKENGQDV